MRPWNSQTTTLVQARSASMPSTALYINLILPRHLVQDLDTEEDWQCAELLVQIILKTSVERLFGYQGFENKYLLYFFESHQMGEHATRQIALL